MSYLDWLEWNYLQNVCAHMVIIATILQHSYVYLKQLLPYDRMRKWLINYVVTHTAIRVTTHSKDIAYTLQVRGSRVGRQFSAGSDCLLT